MHNANILFRDLYGLTLVLFIGLVVILLMAEQAKTQADAAAPGNLMASITWPEGDDDVDIWLDAPYEPVPVGYSNKGGLVWNLLRDDLGKYPDYTPLNYENAFTRGLPAGEYRINVHCYRCEKFPIPVTLEVSKKANNSNSVSSIASSTITLTENHQEKTGLDFKLDDAGNVVPGSLNTIFKPLRSGSK